MTEDGRTGGIAGPLSGALSATLGELLAGRYEILGLIGVGGMGSVYRAKDRELDEVVAVKTLRRELVAAPGMIERFRREVKLARRVTHKNVARVFDIGEHQGDRFLTMELVEGESLGARLARGPISLHDAVEIASGICAGLGAAHAAGVVHRDLKPDNVLLAKDGRVVVTDFGIARALESTDAGMTLGVMLGTPAYMAPEQVEHGREIDARTDIYALGALLFEMLTGKRAWAGESPLAVAAARLISPPPEPQSVRPDLPTAFATAVVKCMQRAPEDRFASAAEVAAAFATVTLPASAATPTLPPPRASITPAAYASPSIVEPSVKTVAVVPFKNGGASDDAYLADELTDDLIDALSMTRGLRVSARGAVQRFAGGDRDPREIGRDLGVQVVVDGSVRKASGRLRVTARLLSVADGFQLWAKRFDRPEHEILQVNDEAAQAIVEALTLEQRKRPARESTDDPIAIDLYLRGRHLYRRFSADDVKASIDLFEQAAARAPENATILAGLASARSRYAFFTGDGLEEAKATAERALAAGPEQPEPRFALASVLLQMGDAVAAMRHLKATIARAPGHAEAHALLGRLLGEVGAVEDGIRRMEASIRIDPIQPLAGGQLARAYALLGQWDRVDDLLKRVAAYDPTSFVNVARLTLWRRDRAAAQALLVNLPETGGPSIPQGFARFIRTESIDESLGPVFPQGDGERGSPRRRAFFRQIEAELAGYTNDVERCLRATTNAVDADLIDLAWLDHCPLLDGIRSEPTFPSLRARVKERADAILAVYAAPSTEAKTRA